MASRLISAPVWLSALPMLWLACQTPRATAPPAGLAPVSSASAASAQRDGLDLDTYCIPDQPAWTDKYAHTDPSADVRHFRMKKLMADFGLSRFQAVELQNHYRDLTRAGTSRTQAFKDALAAVRSGRMGSGIDPKKLASAPFIVVYDLDETLLQRYYKSGSRGPAFRDFSYTARGEEFHVKLRPGWEQAIRRVHELGGMVILFTAGVDDGAEAAAQKWNLDGKNILEMVDGLMTKSHLILQEKADGDPVVLPSKDLRIFDESLDRVIIVDDNPNLIVQHRRHRLIKKFQADLYLAAKYEGRGLTAPFEETLPQVVREIEESVQYMKSNSGVRFGQAYLPYTMLGSIAVEALISTGMKPDGARKYIRQNPEFVDERF